MQARVPLIASVVAISLCLSLASAGDLTDSLKPGTPDIQSAGPLGFGPDGILFVGDPMGGAVFALDTGDRQGTAKPVNVTGLLGKVAARLGTEPSQVFILDLAVNPLSGKVYLSVSRGRGRDAVPVLLQLSSDGKLQEVPLDGIRFARASLRSIPGPEKQGRGGQPLRAESITDVVYVDGRVFVAGLSNEEWASTLRSIPFPFQETEQGAGIEIFHGAHGRFETYAPIRTFASFMIDKEPHIVAAYTCTPLVKIPVAKLQAGAQVKGVTVAELGNRNRPLDMVVYEKAGKKYILLANSDRGIMKITTDGIDGIEAITNPVPGGGTAGLTYDKIPDWTGVQQLDKLDDTQALLLREDDAGELNLQTVEFP